MGAPAATCLKMLIAAGTALALRRHLLVGIGITGRGVLLEVGKLPLGEALAPSPLQVGRQVALEDKLLGLAWWILGIPACWAT